MQADAKQLFANSYLHIYMAAYVHGDHWWMGSDGRNRWNRKDCYTCDVLYYIKRGFFRLRMDGQWHTLTENQMLYIPAGTQLEYHIEDDGLLEKYYVHFDLLFGRIRPTACFSFPLVIDVANIGKADLLFEELVSSTDAFGLEEQGALLRLISFFLKESCAVLRHQTPMQKAALFINDHCHENISVSALAESCGYSKDHFTRKFKEVYGCSPRQYISTAKLNRAKELLLTTDQSISQIAAALGFCDTGHFTNFFYSKTQLSPTYFRKKW